MTALYFFWREHCRVANTVGRRSRQTNQSLRSPLRSRIAFRSRACSRIHFPSYEIDRPTIHSFRSFAASFSYKLLAVAFASRFFVFYPLALLAVLGGAAVSERETRAQFICVVFCVVLLRVCVCACSSQCVSVCSRRL